MRQPSRLFRSHPSRPTQMWGSAAGRKLEPTIRLIENAIAKLEANGIHVILVAVCELPCESDELSKATRRGTHHFA